MSLSHRLTAHRLGAVLVVALVALSGFAPHAHAATTSRSQDVHRVSQPIPAGAISGELLRSTGHSASQLSTRAACGSAPAGHFRCYARVLTVKRSGRAASLLRAPRAATAGLRTSNSGTTAPQPYTAGYLQWAYDTTWLSANRGTGDTVAIVDAYGDSTAYSDMEQFRSANGLTQIPTCANSSSTSCLEVVSQTGSTTNLPTDVNDETGSWNIEESLDIDAVSSLCPLCKILVVEAKSDDDRGHPDLETAVSEAAALGANQISLSWGVDASPDWETYSSPYSSISSAAILAAAGDDSYPGPEVGYPAALPDVTAVGGTSLAADATSPRGFDESTWSVESCAGNATCATESGCDTSQQIPAYQSGVTTDCSGRAYNDISADADPNTGLEIYDSQPDDEGCGDVSNMCIVGGTSLATPLTAAFEAITGITSTTPAWTYGPDASLLNDIVSGSDGSCTTLICNAGPGWDGPTGNGSINGDVVSGTTGSGPGIGALPAATNVTASSADVSAEVDPNDSFASAGTTYYWQYGITTSYGSSTTSTPLSPGAAFQSATGTLALTEPCTYHYRIVASNTIGTVYGYDQTVTTPPSTAPTVATSPPTITGSAAVGQPLTEQGDQWSGFVCDTTYQWQESPSLSTPSWTAISGATSPTYTPTASDAGDYLEVVVTTTNNGGSTSASSAPTAQIPTTTGDSTSSSGTTTSTTTTPTTTPAPPTTAPTPGTPTTTTKSSTGATTTTTVRFYRCAPTCALIDTHGATSFRAVKADYGHYIKIVTEVVRISGNVETDTTTTRWIGPIGAPTAGSIGISRGARVAATTIVRGSTGTALAQVRVSRRSASKLTLVIRRETRAPAQVWAYVIAGGKVVSGTAARSLSRPATLSFTLKRGQTIRLVAVRT